MEFWLPGSFHTQVIVFALVLTRLSGLFVIAPFFAGPAVPQRLRVILALGLAICIAPTVWNQGDTAIALMRHPATMVLALVSEFSVGVIAGFVATTVLATVQTAGYLISQDVGMTMANVLDPMTNRQTSVLGQFMMTLAVLIFLLMDFHHHLVKLVQKSFEWIPLGVLTERATEGFFADATRSFAVEGGSQLFRNAVQIAMPATVTLILVTVAMGFLSRAVPEINIFIIGFAIRILVGFTVVVLVFPFFEQIYTGLFEYAMERCARLLVALSGA